MSRKTALVPAVAIAAALVALPAAPGRSSPDAKERVAVEDNFFSPRSLTVRRGVTVKWNWKGENRHNLVFRKVPKGASDRGARTKREGRWKRMFWKRGRYSYVCTIFAGMRGDVTVSEEAEASKPGEALDNLLALPPGS